MKSMLIIPVLAMGLAACSPARENRVLTGAAIGGAAGAVVGGVASGTGGGALAGAAIGAVGGGIIADATRPRYSRCYYSPRMGRNVCRR